MRLKDGVYRASMFSRFLDIFSAKKFGFLLMATAREHAFMAFLMLMITEDIDSRVAKTFIDFAAFQSRIIPPRR